MQDFNHPHVMSLIGVCLDSGIGVVMPYMVNGSVLSYLKKERETLLLIDNAELEEVRTAGSEQQAKESNTLNFVYFVCVYTDSSST